MSIVLRTILIVASLVAMLLVIRKIRKSKMRIEDAVFWVIAAIMLIVLAIWPIIMYKLSDLVGTQSPTNLLYLIIITIMLVKIFTMSVHISELESKISELTQNLALSKHDIEEDKKEKP